MCLYNREFLTKIIKRMKLQHSLKTGMYENFYATESARSTESFIVFSICNNSPVWILHPSFLHNLWELILQFTLHELKGSTSFFYLR